MQLLGKPLACQAALARSRPQSDCMAHRLLGSFCLLRAGGHNGNRALFVAAGMEASVQAAP